MSTHTRIRYVHQGTEQTVILASPITSGGFVSGQSVDSLHRKLGHVSIPVEEIKSRTAVYPDYFLRGALSEAEQLDARAAELAGQMTGWLATPVSLPSPETSGASTELLEWCRSARDLLALMAGE